MVVLLVLLILSLTGIEGGKHDIYARNKVYSISLRDQSDLQFLGQLEYDLDLDVWQRGAPALRDLHVMTTPHNEEPLLDQLEKQGIQYRVHLDNLPRLLEEFDNSMLRAKSLRNVDVRPFAHYLRYAEVDEYMERLAADYPNLVTIVNVGNSFEGRPLKYLKISTTNFEDPTKPIFFMEALLHSREWVTTAVALYSIHRLVEDLRTEDQDLLDSFDWIIWPVVNPDGYEYSHTDDRMWRQTRSHNPAVSATCYGVDANRNFNVSFNTVGVSTNPCANTYPGAAPFSEPETGFVRDVLFEHLNRTEIFFDVHSHGNYVLYAYGDRSLPPNAVAIHHLGAIMGAYMDISKTDETNYYLVGNSAIVLYGTSGTAQDYAQHIGVPFSYTLELPGYGRGFIVPPEYIPHFTEETWRGIAAGARIAKLHYKGPYQVAAPAP